MTPATISNDHPSTITISGEGFGDITGATVGGVPLSHLTVQSPTALRGTVPAGLCPGAYPARLTNARGQAFAGGKLTVRPIQSVTLDPPTAQPTIALTGHAQVRSLALPTLHLVDTTCTRGSISLSIDVAVVRAGASGDALIPRAAHLPASAATPDRRVTMTTHDGRGVAEVSLPRNGKPVDWALHPTVDVEIPANAYAGVYHLDVSAHITTGR